MPGSRDRSAGIGAMTRSWAPISSASTATAAGATVRRECTRCFAAKGFGAATRGLRA